MASTKTTKVEAMRNKKATIKSLRERLLNGAPDSVYQTRQQIVFALAKLEARTVLMEYLRKPLKIADPVVRAAEEAVQSSAARELARWKNKKTFDFLLEFAKKCHRTGTLEALAEFERIETTPIFIATLEDDFYRPAAEKGLRKLGSTAKSDLIRSLLIPVKQRGFEPPWSVRRRQSILSILLDANFIHDDWKAVRALIKDSHPEIIAGISVLAASFAPAKDRSRAAQRIIAVYAKAAGDWRTVRDLEECLIKLQPESAIALDRAFERQIFENNPKIMERLVRVRNKLKA